MGIEEDFIAGGSFGFLELIPGSVQVVYSGTPAINVGNGVNDTYVSVSIPEITLAEPEVFVTYEARITDAVAPTQVINQQTTLHYQSIPATSANPTRSNVRDYTAEFASTDLVVDDVSSTDGGEFVTELDATPGNQLTIGEDATITFNITLIEGMYEVEGLFDIITAAADGIIEITAATISGAPLDGFTSSNYTTSGPTTDVDVLADSGLDTAPGVLDGLLDTLRVKLGEIPASGDNTTNAENYNDVVSITVTFHATPAPGNVFGDTFNVTTGVTTVSGTQTNDPMEFTL